MSEELVVQKESTRKLTITKDDVKACLGCGKDASGVQFKGFCQPTSMCSHFYSEGTKWWLRIDHHCDIFHKDRPYTDRVGELKCPECLEKHSKMINTLLDL